MNIKCGNDKRSAKHYRLYGHAMVREEYPVTAIAVGQWLENSLKLFRRRKNATI